MRKVTQQIANAFMARKAKTIGNTHTDGESIWLHGNEIVRRNESDEIEISLAGWPTVTTRERLKPFANVCQRKGEQYLNGKQIEDLRGWHLAVHAQWICRGLLGRKNFSQ